MAYQKYKDIPNRREPLAGRDHIQHIENEVIRELARVEPKGDFLPLTGVHLRTVTTGDVAAVDAIGGTLYGREMGAESNLYRSDDDGDTWSLVHAFPTGAISGVFRLGDGEMLANLGTSLYRSTGWGTGTVTWAQVATATSGALIQPFNISVHDRYVLAGEYWTPDRTPSRFLRFSQDYGQTFTNLLDLNAMFPGNESKAHWHAACIDPWANTPSGIRLWASHGDGAGFQAIIYSDDLGATWTTLVSDKQPTTMTATPHGIVTVSDNAPDGVYRIARTDNPADMTHEPIHLIRKGGVNDSLYGFAQKAFYHAESGLVYATFNASPAGSQPLILVSDGIYASEVYEGSFSTTDMIECEMVSVVDGGRVHWRMREASTGTHYWASSDQVARGARTASDLAPGGQLTGTADKTGVGIGANAHARADSVVIGADAIQAPETRGGVAVGRRAELAKDYGVAVGSEAKAGGTYNTVVGYQAHVPENFGTAYGHTAEARAEGVAIGAGAKSSGTSDTHGRYGVAVGRNAKNPSTAGGIAVGYQAETASAATNGIAIGRSTKATSAESTAVGANATASATNAVALGKSAAATNARSVALGFESTTTAADQVQIGARHIELGELESDPAAPPEDKARLFARDNGSGKTEICVRFATGAVAVLATEP